MYEYRVIPAPKRGKKARGLRSPEERFAKALEDLMGEMAADGWEYLRSDTLPYEERAGIRGTRSSFHTVLVFQRFDDGLDLVEEDVHDADLAPVPQPEPEPEYEPEPEPIPQAEQDAMPSMYSGTAARDDLPERD